jgi:uncharacterized protein
MRERPFHPGHLDVEAFAQRAGVLTGEIPLRKLARLLEAIHPEALPGETDQVSWQARGESRAARGAAAQPWLHLQATGQVALVCQRCLQPVEASLEVDAHFRFVAGEAEAAQADLDAEEDVLASTRALDLTSLLEDELLLALPLVPRHASCPVPLAIGATPDAGADALPTDRQRPFEALAGFKARKPTQ